MSPALRRTVSLLSFPPFRLDLDGERLFRDDKEVQLRRKPFAILRYLVRNPQRLVTHAEVVEAVWGKIAMSESLLRTHVHDLRSVVGEGIVETVVKRGYRFIADISHLYPDEQGIAATGTAPKRVVGRDADLAVLAAALKSARERRRTTVFITGEAGIGKTTLVDTFLEQFSGSVAMGRGACVEQYGTGQAYLPVLDAIGALCRGRGGQRAIEAFTERAPTWLAQMPGLLSPDRFAEIQRRAGGATQARSHREIGEALDALGAVDPVVLVLEDLQWVDSSTAELLAFLAVRREQSRVLIVGTYRPAEVVRGHPLARVTGELLAHRLASTLDLEGFNVESVGAYLSSRFLAHDFPSSLAATLHQSSGGNPLFVAILVDDLEAQSLVCQRGAHWELVTTVDDVAARRPDSIRRLIDTQIDRLSASEQRIVEVAAVVGLTFTAGVVAHALDADADEVDSSCERLAHERKLLQFVGTEVWPDGTIQSRYSFGHSLFQHAALMRSTSATVRARHRKIGERLEAGYAAHEDAVVAELAVHFDRGQVPAKAVHYNIAAGDRAGELYGLHESIAHYERAQSLLEVVPQSRERDALAMRAALGVGWRLFQRDGSTERALPALELARELAARLDEKGSLSEVLIRLASLELVSGDVRAASKQVDDAVSLIDHAPERLRAFAHELQAILVLVSGDIEGACRRFDALGVFRAPSGETSSKEAPRIAAMAFGGYALWLAGKQDAALALARRGYEAAEALNDPWERAALLADCATLHAWRREPAEARELARRSLELSEHGAFGLWTQRAELVLRWADAELHAPLAEARVDELLNKPRTDATLGRALPAVLFASTCARLGRVERALETVSEALAWIERTEDRWLEPELHRLRGEMLIPSDPVEAERSIAKALEIARAQSSLSLELRAAISLHSATSDATKTRARKDVARVLARMAKEEAPPDVIEARRILDAP